MINSKIVFAQVFDAIKLREDDDERREIAYLIVEHVLGLTKQDIRMEKNLSVSDEDTAVIGHMLEKINRHEPIQYVLGYAYFLGLKFKVTPSVLIPRPETEELVLAVEEFLRGSKLSAPKILDVGTGSGCIPTSLAVRFPAASVSAIDISDEAIAVAEQNATFHSARVNFQKSDFLTKPIVIENLDVVVSNPPYIAHEEATSMSENVKNFEPHLALFVSDENPLVFYNALARYGNRYLRQNGLLAVEINARFGEEVRNHFVAEGFREVVVRKDINGKDRIVTAIR